MKTSVLKTTVSTDDITDDISSAFDYEFTGDTETTIEIPDIDRNFGIGLIVGGSGSGKSTILNAIGEPDTIVWDPSKAVASHFLNSDDAKARLSGVGLNSIPSWLKPYHCLSNGEQFRADMARRLKDYAIIDEFTSVVDRNVAKSCANSIGRYIRVNNLKNIIFASCHYDIIDWLQPDWVYNTNTREMTRGLERQRPDIVVHLVPCSYKAWAYFRDHHYLSSDINRSSRCWLAIMDNVVVGFTSAVTFPSGSFNNAWRGHRTVVLPEYQGFGIGTKISDATAEILLANGCRYFSKTANPRMGEYRDRSPKWRPTSKNKMTRKDYKGYTKERTYDCRDKIKHRDRLCWSHEYIG